MDIISKTAGPYTFWAGDTGPNLEFILLWDGGGAVNLFEAEVTLTIRRWDNRKQQPIGAVVTSGPCIITNHDRGECKFIWTAATPVATVPIDTGYYLGQVTVEMPEGVTQRSQRFTFSVMSGN